VYILITYFGLQVKLVQHTYSCMFGTFLCNTNQERRKEELDKYTASVWSVLNQNNKQFINHLYNPTVEQQVEISL